jgi:splicing factor U2AF subunit
MEDVKDECERYGRVQNIIIPRPAEGAEPHETKGLGRIIVEMRNVDEAKNVRRNIAGRLYMDRTVEVTFLSEDRYVNGDFIEI